MRISQDQESSSNVECESLLWCRLQSALKDVAKLGARILQLESEKASLEAFFVGDDSSNQVRLASQ